MLKISLITFLTCVASLSVCEEAISKEAVMEETPAYLYKILSLRNWQATQHRASVALSADDDQFIHFSKPDQLERILTKYWADAPAYVVLKIDTSRLQGKMVYEANPNGSAKYYHLYDGFIPFDAISEAQVTYTKLANTKSTSLDVSMLGDPVLRKVARTLTKEEILSEEIQTLIQDMATTMRNAPGVGLAAPQVGKSIQLAVIEDMDHSHLNKQQLAERERAEVPFHVIINPKLYFEGTETAEFFEGCVSSPSLLGIVPRAKSVRVECLNEKAEPIVIHAKGWYARILQHEIDHLNGKMCTEQSYPETVMTNDSYMKLWKNKSVAEIKSSLIAQ